MEFVLNVKATGTEAFGSAATQAAQAIDRTEQTARRLARWQAELAKLARLRREEARAALPAEEALERLLARRARLEERLRRSGGSETRATALRLGVARVDAEIRGLQGTRGGNGERMARWQGEMAELARRRREELARALPLEAQLERAAARRARLDRWLGRPELAPERRAALRLSLARVDATARGLQSELGAEPTSVARMARWQGEMAQLARRRREESFRALPVEDQHRRLTERRARLEERIGSAQGNQARVAALRLSLARTETQLMEVGERRRAGWLGALSMLPGGAGLSQNWEVIKALGKRALPWLAGGAAVYGTSKWLNGRVKEAQALTDLSDRSGIGRGDLQGLTFGASATGTPMGVVTGAYETWAKSIGEVLSGLGRSEGKLKAFDKLGFSMEALRRRTPMDLFSQLVTQMGKSQVTTEQYAAALKVLGENFRDLVPAARDGLGAMMKDFTASKSGMSEAALDVLDKVGSEWDAKKASAGAWAKKWSGQTAAAAITVGKGLVSAGVWAPLSLMPGALGRWAENKQTEYNTDIVNWWQGGDGSRAADEQAKLLADRLAAEEGKLRREALAKEIRQVMGDDGEEAVEQLETQDARVEDYERLLARAKREKGKRERTAAEKIGRGKGLLPTGDELSRIGLYQGEGAMREAMRRQTQILEGINRGQQAANAQLAEVNRNLTREN